MPCSPAKARRLLNDGKAKVLQTRLPTGKLFGLRKHDLVRTEKGTGFVKGKRSTGFFALETIDGQTLTPSVNVKKATTRLAARTTTLIQRKGGASSPL